MLLSYEVLTTFGISALLSFTVFTTILLLLAAKGGLLRVTKRGDQSTLNKKIVSEKLLRPQNMPAPTAPELTPTASRHLLGPQD